jgi:uncharacterized protein YaaR (DUF327 family)
MGGSMSDDANSQRTRFRRVELWSLVALVIGGEIIGIGGAFAATRASNTELFKIFATAATTLFFGSLLGGVISLVIADFDRRRLQRAAQVQFISNVLSDLKSVYDSVDRGRTLLRAHQSAKTYGEVMKEFIAARVKLLMVLRALNFDERGRPIAEIHSEVKSMEKYLSKLIEEFEAQYKAVSRIQSVYEARMKLAVEAEAQRLQPKAGAPATGVDPPADAGPDDPALPANEPWIAIANYPHVKDFIGPLKAGETKSGYSEFFLDALDEASVLLRGALLEEFQ